MIRLIVYLALLLAITIAGCWLADHHGTLTITWLGYQVETSVSLVSALLLLLLSILLVSFYEITRYALHHRFKHRRERQRHSPQAFLEAFWLFAGGDYTAAQAILEKDGVQQLAESRMLLRWIQQITGRGAILAMPEDHEYAQLADLHLRARNAWQQQKFDQALKDTQRALGLRRNLPWAMQLLAEIYLRQNRPEEALPYARKLYKSAPALATTLLLSKTYIALDKRWLALRLLRAGWQNFPDAALVEQFQKISPGESPVKQLARLEKFIAVNPETIHSHLAVGHAALAAGDIGKARREARLALAIEENAEACRLMADAEKASSGEADMVIEWLERATNADKPAKNPPLVIESSRF